MKRLNKFGQVALIAVLAVALSMTACKQGSSGSNADEGSGGANSVLKFTKKLKWKCFYS